MYSCVLPSKVRSIVTLSQHRMSCGRPTDQRLFAGYIRGVRVTASWGATWITPGNHLRAYFDLRVVVWLTGEGLGRTGISKKSVCSRRIGIASGRRKSALSILSAQRTLRGPQHDGCILGRWVQYNPHPVRPVHPDGPFPTLISRRTPR